VSPKRHVNNVQRVKNSSSSTVLNSFLSCVYSNVDSFLNKRTEFCHIIELEQPDIVCLTEIVPKCFKFAVQRVELEIDGYDCFPKIERDNAERGVLIYVKKYLEAQEVLLAEQDKTKDNVWVEIQLKDRDRLLIGCVYRSPNNTEDKNDKLYDLIKAAIGRRTQVLLVGDFNHPEINWENETSPASDNHKATIFMESVVRENFLYQHIRNPTHYRAEQSPTLVDLVFTKEEGMIKEILHSAPIGKSHHQVLSFEYRTNTQNIGAKQEARFLYSRADYDGLRQKMREQNLCDRLQDKNVTEGWNLLCEAYNQALVKCVPKSKGTNKNQLKIKKKPLWMNEKALIKIKKKKAAFKRYMETKEGKDYLMYAKVRNQASTECKRAIKEYERSLAKKAQCNPKAFYAYANSKLKTKQGVADLTDGEGNTATNNKDKADTLNRFFCSVFTKENTQNMPTCEQRRVRSELRNIDFTRESILKRLQSLNPTKSPGSDGMHSRVLKELADELAEPLTMLFTKSLEEGVLPSSWKEANVTPIFKKGKKSDPGNYRPVSLTSIVCKVMESEIRDKIIGHLCQNELLSDCQHGFIPKRSCVTNLLATMDNWTESLDEGKPVDAVYLDFAKAFDSVPQLRLIRKIEAYGITGKVQKWIRHFLIGRQQRVAVNGSVSEWSPVTSGVPQGSVLGPVLFVIFINDLPDVLRSWCEMYADDTKVSTTVETDAAHQILQTDIDRLVEWADTWQLRFNASKCKVIHFGRNNPKHRYTMRLHHSENRTTLETSALEKDLGVQVDSDLKFSCHIEMQVTKANKILGLIRRSYQFLDEECMRMLFTALVRPHLEFANVAWSPRYQKDKILIEGVLRRATKLVPRLTSLPYEMRLERLKVPSMQYRRDRGDMIEVYKYAHHLYDVSSPLTFEESSRTRGHNQKLRKIRVNTGVRQNFFPLRVIDTWNKLPEDIVNAPTLNSFKNRIDQLWGGHMYQT